jgi:uncharacterized protein YqfB (UPF0267 family)
LKIVLAITFWAVYAASLSGQTTIGSKSKSEREPAAAHKVMIIPFEPKLYMSEIDRSVNAETGMTAKQIRHKFRDGMNEQLYKAFKTAKYNVVDLMDDTAKYKKDLEGIYQYLTYQYQKVPDQEHYKAPEKEKEEKKIEKGQLNVETNSDLRFMNAKITNAKVVPLLYAKYKTDIFVFVNQLDLKSAGSPGKANLGVNPDRLVTVHYTVYTYDAKEINSGIAEVEFEPELNNPKKIVDKHFQKLADAIVQRVNKALGVAAK